MGLYFLFFLHFLDGALFYVRLMPFLALENSKESKLSFRAEDSPRVSSSSFPLPAVSAMLPFLQQKKQDTAILLLPILKSLAIAGIILFRMQYPEIL